MGKLNQSGAAQNWQNDFIDYLVSNGFRKGRSPPCNFWHPIRQLHLTVHGEDFAPIGPEKSLRWFEGLLNQRYECKHMLLCPSGENAVRVLNRILTWKSDGIHYEVDQRHVELVVAQLKLDEAKSAITLGIRDEQNQSFETESQPMSP